MNKARLPLPPPVPPEPESPSPPGPVDGGGGGSGSGGGDGGDEAVHGTGTIKNSIQICVPESSPPPHPAKEAKMGSSSAWHALLAILELSFIGTFSNSRRSTASRPDDHSHRRRL
jgi:hypothetical protein